MAKAVKPERRRSGRGCNRQSRYRNTQGAEARPGNITGPDTPPARAAAPPRRSERQASSLVPARGRIWQALMEATLQEVDMVIALTLAGLAGAYALGRWHERRITNRRIVQAMLAQVAEATP